jgi:class 3 adenylate cyclase
MERPFPRKTRPPNESAVLFADVAGSTRLYEQAGDAEALATIGRCLTLAENVARGYGGRLIKTIGDEAMLVFAAADQAIEAAGEIQARMAGAPPHGTVRVAFRVGIHCGPAIERDGDVFGDSVNVAARMVGGPRAGRSSGPAPRTRRCRRGRAGACVK